MIKKTKFPKISIITVVLNNDKTIERCINSVINQKYPNKKIEHIIIDGGSKDSTVSIIKRYRNKITYWHSKKDKGLFDAMNIGIKKSSGNIIGILNSDDYFNKNALKIVSSYFSKYKIDFLFGSVKKNRIYHNFFPKKLWYTFNIYPSHSVSFFINKYAQKKIGKYNIKFKYSSDRDLIYRIIRNKNLKGIATKKNEILGTFSMSGLSSKISFYQKISEEFKIRLANKESLFQIIVVMVVFSFYHFLKKLKKEIVKI
ncbi:MAG: glycosyl transferase [Chloroflexi bacterium]|nr:glycosyl transferase [Chloroflexota bacterium]|tara:strand:- start:13083 stop:13853 length:771 start_codon:yes stop_codon:yes gene_type:complete